MIAIVIQPQADDMESDVAIGLGALIVGLIAADVMLTDGENLFFLAVKFLDLIDWMIFWR
jgi:hypothetical protein